MQLILIFTKLFIFDNDITKLIIICPTILDHSTFPDDSGLSSSGGNDEDTFKKAQHGKDTMYFIQYSERFSLHLVWATRYDFYAMIL